MRSHHWGFAGVLAAGLLTGIGAGSSRAAAPTLRLRYHFVAGQLLTYNATGSGSTMIKRAGKTVDDEHFASSYRARYQFTAVHSNGDAQLTITRDQYAGKQTVNGKVTDIGQTKAFQKSYLQQADGKQYIVHKQSQGAYSDGDLGLLPAAPVSVGAIWITAVENNAGLPPSQKMVCRNRVMQVDGLAGARIAEISTACAVTAPLNFSQNGTRFALQVTGTLGGTWQFDIDHGRFLSQHLLSTLLIAGTTSSRSVTEPLTISHTTKNTIQYHAK